LRYTFESNIWKKGLLVLSEARDLDLFGCWSKEDVVEFESATQDFDCIDPEDWKS